MRTYLNDSANFAGRRASIGSVRNDTKKHTAAPSKQPPNPSNLPLYQRLQSFVRYPHSPIPSRQRKIRLLLIRPLARAQWYVAIAYGIVEAGERIRPRCALLRVVVVAAGPTKLRQVRSEVLFCGRRGGHGEKYTLEPVSDDEPRSVIGARRSNALALGGSVRQGGVSQYASN